MLPRVKIIELLMQYKSPVDPHNKAGWTPLHRAASNGRLEAIKKLLLSGAHINAKWVRLVGQAYEFDERESTIGCLDGLHHSRA